MMSPEATDAYAALRQALRSLAVSLSTKSYRQLITKLADHLDAQLEEDPE